MQTRGPTSLFYDVSGLNLSSFERGDALRTIFTAGKIAKLYQVPRQTVSEWISSGKLVGALIGGHMRFTRQSLIQFMRGEGMSVKPLGAPDVENKILYVGPFSVTRDLLNDHYSSGDVGFLVCGNCYEAWNRLSSLQPDCILMDLGMEEDEVLTFVSDLRDDLKCSDIPLIGFIQKKGDVDYSGFNEVIQRPFDPESLVELVERHMGQKSVSA